MTREHVIQNQIRLWCGKHDILCFRCNVGRVRLDNGYFFDTGLPEGFPDLIILFNKTIYFCEVKTKSGKQRQAQIDFMEEVRRRGYNYFVARSTQDVEKILYGQ